MIISSYIQILFFLYFSKVLVVFFHVLPKHFVFIFATVKWTLFSSISSHLLYLIYKIAFDFFFGRGVYSSRIGGLY